MFVITVSGIKNNFGWMHPEGFTILCEIVASQSVVKQTASCFANLFALSYNCFDGFGDKRASVYLKMICSTHFKFMVNSCFYANYDSNFSGLE